MVDGWWLMVDGSLVSVMMVDGRWSMVMVNGRWLINHGQWSMLYGSDITVEELEYSSSLNISI